MGCFGQCSGKEGTGLYCAAGEPILKGLRGACERKRGRRRTFQGGSFLTLNQQNVTGASHFGHIVSKSEYLRKVGTFSETGQVRGHREK